MLLENSNLNYQMQIVQSNNKKETFEKSNQNSRELLNS